MNPILLVFTCFYPEFVFSSGPKDPKRSWLHLWGWPLRAVGTAAGSPGRRRSVLVTQWATTEAVGCWNASGRFLPFSAHLTHLTLKYFEVSGKSQKPATVWGQNFEPCAWQKRHGPSKVTLIRLAADSSDLPQRLAKQFVGSGDWGQHRSARLSRWGTLKIP